MLQPGGGASGGEGGGQGDSSEGKDEGAAATGWGCYRLMLNATFIEVRRISRLKY